MDPAAAVFGVGVPALAVHEPVPVEAEARILKAGDRSRELEALQTAAFRIEGMPLDYAIMRLGVMAGRPLMAMMEDRQPGPVVSMDVPAGSLVAVINQLVAGQGMRWRFDGQTVWVFRERIWRLPLPDHPDLRTAVVMSVMEEQPASARVSGSDLIFEATREGADRVAVRAAKIYAASRVYPADVSFHLVYPASGRILWDRLADRTEAIEAMAFQPGGVGIVLSGTASAVIDAFLAREGQVRPIGSVTMVSAEGGPPAYRYAGCGEGTLKARTLELRMAAGSAGRVVVRYRLAGGQASLAGQMEVEPGAVLVLADAVPEEGAYLVTVVRPRVVEMRREPAVVTAGSASETISVATTPIPASAAAGEP